MYFAQLHMHPCHGLTHTHTHKHTNTYTRIYTRTHRRSAVALLCGEASSLKQLRTMLKEHRANLPWSWEQLQELQHTRDTAAHHLHPHDGTAKGTSTTTTAAAAAAAVAGGSSSVAIGGQAPYKRPNLADTKGVTSMKYGLNLDMDFGSKVRARQRREHATHQRHDMVVPGSDVSMQHTSDMTWRRQAAT